METLFLPNPVFPRQTLPKRKPRFPTETLAKPQTIFSLETLPKPKPRFPTETLSAENQLSTEKLASEVFHAFYERTLSHAEELFQMKDFMD